MKSEEIFSFDFFFYVLWISQNFHRIFSNELLLISFCILPHYLSEDIINTLTDVLIDFKLLFPTNSLNFYIVIKTFLRTFYFTTCRGFIKLDRVNVIFRVVVLVSFYIRIFLTGQKRIIDCN